MNRLKRILALLLVFAMGLSLAACQKSQETNDGSAQVEDSSNSGDGADKTSDKEEETPDFTAQNQDGPVYGGSMTLTFSVFYNEYDPAASGLRGYISYFYDRLWNYAWSDPDFTMVEAVSNMDNLEPGLAESWEYDAETGTLTVNLHNDVYFQDKSAVGMEDYDIYGSRNLVASDVKWSYDRLLGLDGVTQVVCDDTNYASSLYMLESVEVVDDYTVAFHLNTAAETALNDFMCVGVYIAGPEWDELTEEQKTDWHYACGTGAFLLSEYSTDSYMTFVKNENYWAYDTRYPENKLPYLDEVTIIRIADTSNQLSQFVAGEVDILAPNDLSTSEIAQLESTMSAEDYNAVTYHEGVFAIGLKQGVSDALDDIRVRQAMNLAMNLQEINDEYLGFDPDMQLTSAFGNTTDFSTVGNWSEEVTEAYYTQNIEKAKALMEEAGYGDGFEFDMSIFSAMDSNLLELAKEYLALIGITTNITVYNTPPEMTAAGSDITSTECINQMAGVTSAESAYAAFHTGGAWNYLGKGDAKLDELTEQMTKAETMEERIVLGQEIDDYLISQYYLLTLSPCEQTKDFYSTKVGGYTGERIWASTTPGFTVAHLWKIAD